MGYLVGLFFFGLSFTYSRELKLFLRDGVPVTVNILVPDAYTHGIALFFARDKYQVTEGEYIGSTSFSFLGNNLERGITGKTKSIDALYLVPKNRIESLWSLKIAKNMMFTLRCIGIFIFVSSLVLSVVKQF